MTIPSDEPIVVETPGRKRWRLATMGLMKAMQRLQRAAQHRAPRGGASRRA